MKFVEESVELIHEYNIAKKIELCGRVCYKSEDKITDSSSDQFIKKIIKSGHESVLEHGHIAINQCRIIDNYLFSNNEYTIGNVRAWRNYFKKVHRSSFINLFKEKYPLFFEDIPATKSTAIIDNLFDDKLNNKELTPYSFRIITDRAIANEIVRHRVFSFSQESTRYINYNKKEIEFILPPEYKKDDDYSTPFNLIIDHCIKSEQNYNYLIERGIKPQFARNILPLCLKTELIMSGYKFQWDDFFKLRCSEAAHPQIRRLANEIKNRITKDTL